MGDKVSKPTESRNKPGIAHTNTKTNVKGPSVSQLNPFAKNVKKSK